LNKDGFNDIILGAPNWKLGTYYVGRAYVIYGQKSSGNIDLNNLDFSQGFSVTGYLSQGLGMSVSNADDMNSDGYDDVIIGAPCLSAAKTYVIYGGSTLFGISNIDLYNLQSTQGISISNSNYENFGSSLSYAGDINNDGHADIIIGAPQYPCETTGTSGSWFCESYGKAYVIFGPTLENF
jgi:hypothetical protein